MPITRIKNNQVTDASAGNLYVGINAAVKLQDYSITAGKIANSLVYGSDFTVTGNLTVNGQTTTIDTVSVVIEDPILYLAANQTGAPALDIGFIGERGTSQNIAFVWDESAGEFVTVYTNDTTTNSTVTIASYANFHTDNANIGGNLVINGTTSLVGNIISALNVTGNFVAANIATGGVINANGNISGGNLISNAAVVATGLISAGSTISATGNITGGNLVSNATIAGVNFVSSGNINVTGNVDANNFNAVNDITAEHLYTTGNAYIGGNLIVSGNLSYNNVEDLRIEDPIIIMGTGANGAPPVADDGMDRGIFMEYYTTAWGNAFVGWDRSSGNMIAAANVDFSGNNIVNVLSYGTLQAGLVYSANILNDGTITTPNVTSLSGLNITSGSNGNITLNPNGTGVIILTDELANAMLYAGPNKEISSDANLTYNGTDVQLLNGNIKVGDAVANVFVTNEGIQGTGRLIINQDNSDVDFAVNGDTTANVFYVDAGTGTASFGNSTQITGAGVTFNFNNSIVAPVGNTAQRPGTPITGMVRFNTTTSSLEFYDSTQWVSTGTIFTVVQSQTFNGDGSTVAFTINSGYTTASCLVSINGILQVPVTAYAVAGTTLTFTEAPATADLIEVREITTTIAVKGITNANGSAVIEVSDSTDYVAVTGNLLPSGNVIYDLGSTTNQWNDLYLAGNTIYLGSVQLQENAGNLRVRNFDNTADAVVEATFLATSTTSGNLQIGLNHIEATNLNGNIELRPNGTGVAFVSTRLQIANVQVADAGANTVVFYRADGTTPATISNQNIDSTQIASGTSSMAVLSSGGNIRANVGGATIATFYAGGINNGQANGVGNIGTSSSYFNTVFAKATSAQYADLAEMYEADAAYEPGTVMCFGGAKEVTVCNTEDCTRVAGVVSTNPSYLMNSGQTGAYVSAVALQGRVPCKVTGQIRKGDLIVSAGDGRGRANNDARAGTIIGKALADFDGQDGVIEVVVGRV
jgi:hypothetical protein